MTWIEVTPAYGRDYKNQKAVKEDWDKNLDFRDTRTGSYITKNEAIKHNLSVNVRYSNLTKIVTVKK
jgi:hypothetical protein